MSEQMSMFGGGGVEKTSQIRRERGAPPSEVQVPLHEEARRRYSIRASVITSRALPDVRDGLKPVQRANPRTGVNATTATHEAKYMNAPSHRTVMGQYHPHGNVAHLRALARMGQNFSLRYPLIDGHGKLRLARRDSRAERYTECPAGSAGVGVLTELGKADRRLPSHL